MADREYSSTDAAHNLTGFSSNKGWAQEEEGLWSHNPVHRGPKEGFHDPIAADPARAELWKGNTEPGAMDETLKGGVL